MAQNPMQRKARNSFILGMVITLVITGVIIGILVMQINKIRQEQAAEAARLKDVYILAEDVKSGEEVTGDLLTTMKVDSSMIPENAMTPIELEEKSTMTDEQGNVTKLLKVVSKIDLGAGTVITSDMVQVEGELTNDLRKVEYNMISLPSQIQSNSYVDVRLRLPGGTDYTVASRKQLTIPATNGIESTNTISLELTELEILTISCAIIENYKIEGSLLYVTEYVEPGLQTAATTTYVPSTETLTLIQTDPNCLEEARNALFNRILGSDGKLNAENQANRNPINNSLDYDPEDALDKVIDNLEEEIQMMQEERQKYLESLGG